MNDLRADALFVAIDRADLESLKRALEAGADPNLCTDTGESPLHIAVWGGDTEVVTILLDAGANVNGENEHGATPIFEAFRLCEYKPDASIEMMEYLISRGANVKRADVYGNTILHYDASASYRCICRALIDAGASINGAMVGRYKLRTYAHKERWIHVVDAIDRRESTKVSRRARTSSGLDL